MRDGDASGWPEQRVATRDRQRRPHPAADGTPVAPPRLRCANGGVDHLPCAITIHGGLSPEHTTSGAPAPRTRARARGRCPRTTLSARRRWGEGRVARDSRRPPTRARRWSPPGITRRVPDGARAARLSIRRHVGGGRGTRRRGRSVLAGRARASSAPCRARHVSSSETVSAHQRK